MKTNILIKHPQMNKVGILTASLVSFILHISTYNYQLKYQKKKSLLRILKPGRLRFKDQLYYILATHIAPMNLSFLNCTMRMTTLITYWDYYAD